MINEYRNTVYYLGENGFPFRFAAVNRQKYIAKGLVKWGFDVQVICRKGVFEKNNSRVKDLNVKGEFDGVKYTYTSGSIYRPTGFVKRNAFKIKGIVLEFFKLVTAIRKRQVNYLLISSFSFYQVFYYFIIAFCSRTKIILDVVERNSAMPERRTYKYFLNDLLYEYFLFKFMDGILFISDELGSYINKNNPNIPSLKVPVVFDYNRIQITNTNREERYVLYCGHVLYFPTIQFILKAFDLISNGDCRLKLVLHGNKIHFDKCRAEVVKISNKHKVTIYNNLTDSELFDYYKNAEALLIPMFDTYQERARFPQKISEYLATANPVLSTEVGEIKQYFKNNETAFLSTEIRPNKFAELMDLVLKDPNNARRVGQNGRRLGESIFHYVNQGKRISEFLKTI